MQHIPRGVADDERLAVVATRAGELVALDPSTGIVRWRHGRGLGACAVTSDVIVAVHGDAEREPAVVVLDSAGGGELWTASIPGIPPWAWRQFAQDPTSPLDCTIEEGQVLLRWRTSTGYEGGAAPDERLLDEHAQTADGCVLVDLRSRSVRLLSPAELSAQVPDVPTIGETTSAHGLADDVLEASRVGRFRLELANATANNSLVLRGVNDANDEEVWEIVLDARLRPPPLPQ